MANVEDIKEGTIVATVNEVSPDFRLRERSVEPMITNNTTSRLEVLAIREFIPEHAEIEEPIEKAVLNSDKKAEVLLHELSLLINDELFFTQESLQEKRAKIVQEFIMQVVGGKPTSVEGGIRVAFRKVWGPLIGWVLVRRFRQLYHQTRVRIESIADARMYLNQINLAKTANKEALALISLKVAELESVNEARSGKGHSIAIIEPGEKHGERFRIRFQSGLLESRQYNIAFEVSIERENAAENEKREIRTTETITIPPSGVLLSVIASVSGCAGYLVRIHAGHLNDTGTINLSLANVSVKLAISAILGMLIFNLYEHFDIAKAQKLQLNWRTATLFGFIGGFASDNFLRGLIAFMGYTNN